MKQFIKNKTYSNKTIQSNLTDITTNGQFVGGEHTIYGTDTYGNKRKFVMLFSNAWRGGKSIFYKCII